MTWVLDALCMPVPTTKRGDLVTVVSQAHVGQRIRRLRRVLGLGQEDFAKKIRIASGSVSKLENGRMPLSEHFSAR